MSLHDRELAAPTLEHATTDALLLPHHATPRVSRPGPVTTFPHDPRQAAVAAAFRAFMQSLGLDLTDPDLAGTDERVARAYARMLRGLRPGAEPRISTFPNTEGHRGVVSVEGIPFYSLCAHHLLPFFGTADVGYIPGDRLLGLSKMPRIVDHFARRPQLQERLAEQVASHLDEQVSPGGVIVVLRARHLCMEMRGVEKRGITTTVAVRGALADPRLQEQFLTRLRAAGTRSVEEV